MSTLQQEKTLLRIPAVCERYGVDQSTIYRWVQAGEFPQPVRLSRNISGWWNTELEDFDESLTRGVRAPINPKAKANAV